jgi:hypothetical protein
VFIDLNKVFDTVDHGVLLVKLEHYGVKGEVLGLLRSYLEGRFQYVVYNRGESGRLLVRCGVPQGSVLGPLFFHIYVNDMMRVSRVLKVGDLYRQQLRLHAWKFCNDRLPDGQMVTLRRVHESHGYGTRSARSGLVVSSGDHRLVAYRLPAKWRTLTVEQRGMRFMGGFKRSSKGDFLVQYGLFQCRVPGCWVCGDCSGGDGDLEG